MTTAPHEAWKRNIRGRSAAHCREARQGERESWISASIRNIRSSPAGPARPMYNSPGWSIRLIRPMADRAPQPRPTAAPFTGRAAAPCRRGRPNMYIRRPARCRASPAGNRPTPGEVPSFTIEDLPEDADGGLSTVEIAKTVGPSVVCINVYEPGSISIAGSGSGIILNEDGFIVTNAHVVEGSSAVTVLLDDGRELDAWIVGSDTRTDLAVVKITADGLVPASFGDSDILQVGERAVAIGNAAGQLSGTVTQGIISGLNREISMQAGNSVVTMNLIQTSAAINPGNSGGALVNRFGQVIGINSAKLNSSTFEGIGFAIPSADAQPVVEDLIAYGYVKDRVALGVMVIALSPVTGPANDLPSQGLYISSVEDYSDLNNHDITVGDVILTADGVTLETTSDLLDVLETHKPGETVRLEIQKRGSGNVVTVDAVLAESRSN